MTATGFAVAGGSSSRMGRDKALLAWGTDTLLDHALRRLRDACGEAVILCGQRPRYLDHGAPAITDVVNGAGPLGALATALEHAGTELALLLAVDVPFAPAALLRDLVAWSKGWDAVVPVAGGREHPLCAVYRRSCGPAVRRRLASGDLKMTSFWRDVRVRQVTQTELAAHGDASLLLRNLNTWKEYQAALSGSS